MYKSTDEQRRAAAAKGAILNYRYQLACKNGNAEPDLAELGKGITPCDNYENTSYPGNPYACNTSSCPLWLLYDGATYTIKGDYVSYHEKTSQLVTAVQTAMRSVLGECCPFWAKQCLEGKIENK
jgi:hypothetical protein